MMNQPENPPAFPAAIAVSASGDEYHGCDGMTLRDYFAIHCDQPGTTEIAAAAGVSIKSPAGVFIIRPDGTEVSWTGWWNALPAAERFALYAKVRFAIADAMLAERRKGGAA